ncbi:capsid cement protein [Megalodesulfovibrio paquesii]
MQSRPILTLPLTASGAVTAHRFVTATGAQVAAAGAAALGVARSDAATGELFPCDALGTGIVEAGGAIAAGVALKAGADGRALTHDTGVKVAISMQAATAAGQKIEVLLLPGA